jgi:hypothetical protein
MSEAAEPPISEEQFLGAVASLCEAEAHLTQLGAGVLVALHHGIAGDSRSFARIFGVEHALVLREVTALADDVAVISVVERNAKTHRTRYALNPRGEDLVSRVFTQAAAEPS